MLYLSYFIKDVIRKLYIFSVMFGPDMLNGMKEQYFSYIQNGEH
jgi:hypothetical protein